MVCSLSRIVQNIVVAAAAISMATCAEAAVMGSPPPDCTLRLSGGANVSISQLRGKVVYLDFWASWCLPCALSFPFMNALARDYRSRGLVVIGVDMDERAEDRRKFVASHPASFAIAEPPNEGCARDFRVPDMPSTFIVDRQGALRVVHTGFRTGDEAELRHTIDALLTAPANR
jgi:thiol-disulfide isomerase/thioredoxin